MTSATQIYRNRIAIIFDFDLTLAPDSFDALLVRCGVDPRTWRDEKIHTLVEAGWDATLARIFRLVELSRSDRGPRVTRSLIEEVGRDLEPYQGVPEMFDRVRRTAREAMPELEVEFYLLTAGFVDIHRATRIAPEFKAMWGSELYFDDEDEVAFGKQIVTHPEKVRYILQLSKGLGTEGPNGPADVYRPVPREQIHMPIDQMIYVGDGGSDMPVFSLMNRRGGTAIAVFKSERAQDWSGHGEMRPSRRVQNLACADFREDSELMQSILLALESIAKKIALRRLGVGE